MKSKDIRRVFSRIPYYRSRLSRIFTHREIPGRLEAWLYYQLYTLRECGSSFTRFLKTDGDRSLATIYLDLENAIQDRYLFQLISFFIYGGCSVRFVTGRPKNCLAPLEYARLVYTFKNFKIIPEPPLDCSDATLCTDRKSSSCLGRNWKMILLLNLDISVDRKDHG